MYIYVHIINNPVTFASRNQFIGRNVFQTIMSCYVHDSLIRKLVNDVNADTNSGSTVRFNSVYIDIYYNRCKPYKEQLNQIPLY